MKSTNFASANDDVILPDIKTVVETLLSKTDLLCVIYEICSSEKVHVRVILCVTNRDPTNVCIVLELFDRKHIDPS